MSLFGAKTVVELEWVGLEGPKWIILSSVINTSMY